MIKRNWKHKNLKESFLGALRGIKFVLKTERNARIILFIGIISLILSFFKIFFLEIDNFNYRNKYGICK